MIFPRIPIDEEFRLRSLHRLGLLDSEKEERFDRLTRIGARMLDVPIVLISLVDKNRQWFKSSVGLEVCETGRDVSFCGHTILNRRPFIIPDALTDPRFADNPLVTGFPHFRSYAGIPLEAEDAALVGSLCVIDHRPRKFLPEEIGLLQDLAVLVQNELTALGDKKLLEIIRKSEESFSGAFAYAAIGMALVSPAGRWLRVNAALCSLTGYFDEDLIGKTFPEMTHPDDVMKFMENLRQLSAGETTSFHSEARYFHKLGHTISLSLHVALVRDSFANPLYFIVQILENGGRKDG